MDRPETARARTGVALDRALADAVSAALGRRIPRSLARAAILAGRARLNGRVERDPSRRVDESDRVVAADTSWIPREREVRTPTVLHEDPDVLAVDKPHGLPTHATADGARVDAVRLLERDHGRLFVQQRLDAETSGVLLFARNASSARRLTETLARRAARKSYVALVSTAGRAIRAGDQWTIDAPLRVARNGRVSVDPDGHAAVTRVRVLECDARSRRALVHAEPVTGRKHQVRAHLAAHGLPVVGDVLYGASRDERVFLHARRLEIAHPREGGLLRLEAPLPDAFRRALKRR